MFRLQRKEEEVVESWSMGCLGGREVTITGCVVCEISSPLSLWGTLQFQHPEIDSYRNRHVNSGTDFYVMFRVSLPSARFERYDQH